MSKDVEAQFQRALEDRYRFERELGVGGPRLAAA